MAYWKLTYPPQAVKSARKFTLGLVRCFLRASQCGDLSPIRITGGRAIPRPTRAICVVALSFLLNQKSSRRRLGSRISAVRPHYNIAPTQAILACRLDTQQHKRELVRLRWGLIPSWASGISIGVKAINAHTETVVEKPSFRHAFKRQHILIPASGFYEWKKIGKTKQPYFIYPREGELFAFAGFMLGKLGKGRRVGPILYDYHNHGEHRPAIPSRTHARHSSIRNLRQLAEPATPQAQLLELLRPSRSESHFIPSMVVWAMFAMTRRD